MPPFNTRPICFRYWSTVEVEWDGRGNILLRSPVPLRPHERRLDGMLEHAAAAFRSAYLWQRGTCKAGASGLTAATVELLNSNQELDLNQRPSGYEPESESKRGTSVGKS